MQKTVLISYPHISSFIRNDITILQKKYRVIEHSFNPSKKWMIPFRFLSQLLFLLKNLWSADLVICWFLGYHSLLPALAGKLTRKPILSILGGTECHSFPSIGYGNFTNKSYGWFTRLSFKLSTHFAPVHKSLVECEYEYDPSGMPNQGYKVFCKDISAPFTEIHFGYESEEFYNTDLARPAFSFLTVALDISGREFYRKGVDLIFAAARNFPDFAFTVIGDSKNISEPVPVNVKLSSRVPYEQLPDLYSSHTFYFQLSMAEGFPNALCEAMLCECVPIGSAVFGIPDIIGTTGFLLHQKNIPQLFDLISDAVQGDNINLGKLARKRITETFSLSKRESKLNYLIEEMTTK